MNEILQSILTEVKTLREEVLSLKGQLEMKVAEEEAFASEKEGSNRIPGAYVKTIS